VAPSQSSPNRWIVGIALVAALGFFALGRAQDDNKTKSADDTTTDSVTDADATSPDDSPNNSKSKPSASESETPIMWPLIKLGIGVAVVLGLIVVFKVNAFLALIAAAMVVSAMSPGDIGGRMGRVASAFGASAGGIGIVIAMAAVIGKCMLDSGSADRIVRAFLRLFGEKRAPMALMGSGFVLAVPVFFDTVFYLLVPLARSLHTKTRKQYLKYLLAIGAGGAITHTLVPPTPGPLLMADNLGVQVGMMIMIGAMVALPAAIAGLLFAGWMDRLMPIPMREIGNEPEPKPLSDDQLPSLGLALLPVLLPVVLISASTVLNTVADSEHRARLTADSVDWPAFQGDLTRQNAEEKENVAQRLLSHTEMTKPVGEDNETTAAELLTSGSELTKKEKEGVVTALNHALLDKKFYDKTAFLGVAVDPVAENLLGKDLERMKLGDVERMNRSLLESAFPAINRHEWKTRWREAATWSNLLGNANLALLLSTIIAMLTLVKQRGLNRDELAKAVETALMSGGVIILITAGGGAFGAMLKAAEVGPAVKALFDGAGNFAETGLAYLFLGFLISLVLKIAQGSSTVAMIVGSSMVAAIIGGESLSFHPVYIATAIGAGSLVGSWMNDSGFWIFAKMGGLTEVEALKTWTMMLVVLGLVSLAMSVLLAMVLPMV